MRAASLSRRRAWLRITAFPTFFETVKPTLGGESEFVSGLPSFACRIKAGATHFRRVAATARYSGRFLMRASFSVGFCVKIFCPETRKADRITHGRLFKCGSAAPSVPATLRRKALTAPSATSSQNLTATYSCFACTETVTAFTYQHTRLKGPFHLFYSSYALGRLLFFTGPSGQISSACITVLAGRVNCHSARIRFAVSLCSIKKIFLPSFAKFNAHIFNVKGSEVLYPY